MKRTFFVIIAVLIAAICMAININYGTSTEVDGTVKVNTIPAGSWWEVVDSLGDFVADSASPGSWVMTMGNGGGSTGSIYVDAPASSSGKDFSVYFHVPQNGTVYGAPFHVN